MGYVPSRRYEKVHATLSRSGMALDLPTTVEDRWFLLHQWLPANGNTMIESNRDGDGCSLHINSDLIGSDEQYDFEGLIVDITAKGLVTIVVIGDAEGASRLRAAAGIPESNQVSAIVSWDMHYRH